MLTVMLTTVALASGLPEVEVVLRGAGALVQVRGPSGEHVAPDAPAYLDARWGDRDVSFAGMGEDLARGLPIVGIRGTELTGALRVSLCEDGGTRCRMVDAELTGAVPPARRGRVALAVRAPGSEGHAERPYRADAASAAARAFADAAARDLPVLIDFTAEWCPPCNLLAAEVLHASEHAEVLADFVLVQVDVDDPSSWPLKDRYAVQGYPTLVVTDAAGGERDRASGYLGAEQTVAWLREVARGPIAAPETPEAHARAAWSKVQRGDADAARALLEGATGAEDTVAYRLARVSLEPSLDDARWLVAAAPERGADWTYAARALGETPAGAAVLREAARAGLRSGPTSGAVDLLYLLATLADASESEAWFAAAAASLRSGFSGDPARDRGHWTGYAHLLHRAGATAEALAFLAEARATFPGEPTWALTSAPMLLDAARPAEALAHVEQDWDHAWGDNRLRMARLKIEALLALDRAVEARAFGQAILDEMPVPEAGVDVRTPRYVAAIRALLDEAAP